MKEIYIIEIKKINAATKEKKNGIISRYFASLNEAKGQIKKYFDAEYDKKIKQNKYARILEVGDRYDLEGDDMALEYMNLGKVVRITARIKSLNNGQIRWTKLI